MGRQRLLPNTENCTLAELQTALKASPTKQGYVRMVAIEKLIEGWDSTTVASFSHVTTQTLRNWIKAFNARGLDGLIDKPRSGAPRKISSKKSQQYEELIKEPMKVGMSHWTGVKFHGFIRKEFEDEVGYRTVIRWLHEKGFRLKVPRPWPVKQDEVARETFIAELQKKMQEPKVDIWYLDETGIEGDPRPRRRWISKGEKATIPYSGGHLRMNVIGLVCPRTGCFYALEFTHVDSEVFQIFLNHANADITLQRETNIIILDNASWHKKKNLQWGNFKVFYLPPYSPDLNPIERLWLLVKAEWFSDFYAKTRDELIERVDNALRWLIDREDENRKTCKVKSK